MNVLIVAEEYPAYDKNSGSLRFLRFLETISSVATSTDFFHCDVNRQNLMVGHDVTERYRQELSRRGINTHFAKLREVLTQKKYDYVFFEFYGPALRYADIARFYQPSAKMIVDTVDVHFKRMFSKFQVEGNPKDLKQARRVRRKELQSYGKADIVITVTAEDRDILLAEDSSIKVEIIPNIHECPPLQEKQFTPNSLIFVGGFRHNPNTDAVLYFCKEILPIVKERLQNVIFTVVGDAPPDEIKALASDHIAVTGYVEDTIPYLEKHAVSVAPLRFGAGMKGKVGEAMAYGTPVVTTSVGSEGFGMTPGVDALVADTPEAFAESVVRLLTDKALYTQVRLNGWRFIHDNYSREVVDDTIVSLLERNSTCPVKPLKASARITFQIQSLLGL